MKCIGYIDWENHARSARYRPGNGEAVMTSWRKDGLWYSGYREYHGPWPAPPPPLYDHPPAPTAVQRAQSILSQYGIELSVENGDYAETDARVTLRFNGETLLDDYQWEDWA